MDVTIDVAKEDDLFGSGSSCPMEVAKKMQKLAHEPDSCRNVLMHYIEMCNSIGVRWMLSFMDNVQPPIPIFSHESWSEGNATVLVLLAMRRSTSRLLEVLKKRIPHHMRERRFPMPALFRLRSYLLGQKNVEFAAETWNISFEDYSLILDNNAFHGETDTVLFVVHVLISKWNDKFMEVYRFIRRAFFEAIRGGRMKTADAIIAKILKINNIHFPGNKQSQKLPDAMWREALSVAFCAFNFTTVKAIQRFMKDNDIPVLPPMLEKTRLVNGWLQVVNS